MNTFWQRLQRLSLYYKVNGLIIGMLFLSSLIIGFIMLQSTSRLLNSQMEKRGVEIASYVASLSSNDVLIEDHFSIFERLNKTRANNEEVRYILVTDSAGRILAHTFSGTLPQGLPQVLLPKTSGLDAVSTPDGATIVRFRSNEGPIREITVPIENGDVGFVRIGMSENTLQILLGQKFNEIILTTLLICFLAGIGATHMAYVIVQPVQDLSHIAKQIENGNYNVQADIRAEDEVGRLAVSFNAMASSLQEKDLENKHLLEELRAKETLRASLMNKLFTVQEDERRRISRELHDETGQSMASLLAYMKVLLAKLTNNDQRDLLMGARDVAINVLEGLRKMAIELRPPVLDYLGIVAALEKYAQNFSQQHRIEMNFSSPSEKLLVSNDIALALYRILQESLTNIAKHADASHVDVELTKSFEHVKMVIRDDGHGIHANALAEALENNRLGLFGMQERAELLGGSLAFRSSPNRGTTIIVILPIGSEGHV